jgi:hypothetical protein
MITIQYGWLKSLHLFVCSSAANDSKWYIFVVFLSSSVVDYQPNQSSIMDGIRPSWMNFVLSLHFFLKRSTFVIPVTYFPCFTSLVPSEPISLVPPVRVSLTMDRSFIVKSVDAWNSLPYALKLSESHKTFMTALKKHFSSVPNWSQHWLFQRFLFIGSSPCLPLQNGHLNNYKKIRCASRARVNLPHIANRLTLTNFYLSCDAQSNFWTVRRSFSRNSYGRYP